MKLGEEKDTRHLRKSCTDIKETLTKAEGFVNDILGAPVDEDRSPVDASGTAFDGLLPSLELEMEKVVYRAHQLTAKLGKLCERI